MSDGLSIIIVGAGLAGLFAALRLGQDGHSVHVFERRSGLSDRGGGIILRPNASRQLINWGLQDDLAAVAESLTIGRARSLTSGELLDERRVQQYTDFPNWGLLRQWLQSILYERTSQLAKVSIHFNAEVTALDLHSSSRGMLHLSDGTRRDADLIIVADGIRSRLRSTVLTASGYRTAYEPFVSSVAVYPTLSTNAYIRSTPTLSALAEEDSSTAWTDGTRHVISGGGSRMGKAIVDFIVDEAGPAHEPAPPTTRMWEEQGDIAYLRRVFHDACPPLHTYLADLQACSRWKVGFLPVLPTWTSGRATAPALLLGDAAHAMLPSGAQGASQAVEDVAALSALLTLRRRTHPHAPDLGLVAQLWYAFRAPRVTRIRAFAHATHAKYGGDTEDPSADEDPTGSSASAGTAWYSPEELERAAQALALHSAGVLPTRSSGGTTAEEVQADMHAEFAAPAFLKWQFDYDLLAELGVFLGSRGADAAGAERGYACG